MDQKENWNRLRQNIHSAVDGITHSNVEESSKKLLSVNILRGQGLFCRYLLQQALQAPDKCALYAAVTTVVALQFPEICELLAVRLAVLFKKAYVNNNISYVNACTMFMCELTIQKVVDDVLILQVLQVFLDKLPSSDGIRIAEQVLRRAGGRLLKTSSAAVSLVFDRLRILLQLGKFYGSSLRRIGELLRCRRDGLTLELDKSLDVVSDSDKECCFVDLTEKLEPRSELNFFQEDPDFERSEMEYNDLKAQFWPVDEADPRQEKEVTKLDPVKDLTDAQLLQSQKNIYLTVMSSMLADEAVHKLTKLQRHQKMTIDVLIDMLIKCCAQDKTYSKYFGAIGEKMCRLGGNWQEAFALQFRDKYHLVFQFEGAQLRNIGKFFGHLLAVDILSLPDTLGHINLTESDTTSAGRVFIKFLFLEMVEELGIASVQTILFERTVKTHLHGIFPVSEVTTDDAEHIMFSINFFTAIGLGVLTEEMRAVLKVLPEPRGRKRTRRASGGSSSSSSSRSLYSRSSGLSFSRSRSGSRSRSYSRSRSGSRDTGLESRSFSRSPSR